MSTQAVPARRSRPRRRASFVGVLGELLITAGVLVVMFVGWQVWLNDIVVGNEQAESARDLSAGWGGLEASDPPAPEEDFGDPVVGTAGAEGEAFATVYIPRFGPDWVRTIAEGTGLGSVLNDPALGVGHYTGTQMPGEVGNFALAAHRQTHGGSFNSINQLTVGDSIIVETVDGWYTYSFQNLEYVQPTGVEVLDPVPQQPSVQPGDRYITLTSCNPLFSTAERIIAYGVMDDWRPRSAGAPDELVQLLTEEA